MIAASRVDSSATRLVGCGRTAVDQQMIIVNPDTCLRCLQGQVGEIWVKGASVAQGYWNREEPTAQTFAATLGDTGEGPFLRTGDLGVIHHDEPFIVGRLKDLVIIRGRNHYPHDIEATVQDSHSSLRSGCGAVFSIPVDDEERLVVVQEVGGHSSIALDSVAAGVGRAVTEHHEVQVYAVVLIKPGTLPKTSSGKVQRHLCRAKFLAHELEAVHTTLHDGQVEREADVAAADVDDETVARVAEVWAQVLGRPHVGPHDNFFELGGDSLQGTQLLVKLQEIYAVDLLLSLCSMLQRQRVWRRRSNQDVDLRRHSCQDDGSGEQKRRRTLVFFTGAILVSRSTCAWQFIQQYSGCAGGQRSTRC